MNNAMQFGIFYGSARCVKRLFASEAEANAYRVKRFGRNTGHYVAAA